MKARFLALAALVLGLASCQTEHEGLNVNVGGEQETYVTVSLPETTRANSSLGAFDNVVTSDEYTIRYIFQVFYEGRESQAARQVIYTDNDRVSFPVRLVPGRHYNFVVWADVTTTEGKTLNTIHNLAIDDAAAADIHYNTADLKNIQIIDVDGGHEWEEMDETRDAFTGQFDTAVDGDQTPYNSAKSINFTLTRPFAKLRVITTDMEQLNDLDIVPTKAAVTYATDHLYSSFNAFAGAVNDAKTTKTHDTFVIKNYNDNVTNKSKVLFTDYLFAADEDEVVNFTLAVYDQNDVIIGKTINFNTPIPARRNYLTTISGNILTDGNKIEVTVEDTFANYDEDGNLTDPNYEYATISSVAELLAAIDANNGEYILISNLDVNGVTTSALAATRATGNGTTINLNGYTITLKTNLTIPEGNTLIINNDPVDNAGDKLGAVVNDGGQIINNGTLNIEGGAFGANTIENNGKVNVNGDDVHENAIDNKDNAVIGSFIYSAEELQTAVNAAVAGTANEFTLAADIEGDVVVVIQKPNVKITIDGAKHKFNGYFRVHSNSNHEASAAVTFKNINFETAKVLYDENNKPYFNFIEALDNGNGERYSTNITAEKCTFTATGEAKEKAVAVGLQIKSSKWAKAINCTATDLHSLVQAQSCDTTVDVIGCTINGKNGVAFKQVKAAKVEGTTIVAREYGIRFDGNTDNYGIVVKNNNITAAQPFIVRKMTGKNNTIVLEGENTLTSTREQYNIVFTNGSDDQAYVAPTGTYTLTGADDFIVYPREIYVAPGFYQTSTGYTIKNAAENSTITLADNVNGTISIEKVKNITIEGNENTVRFETTKDSKLENVTIKNVNFVYDGSNVNFGIVINAEAQIDNLFVEDCSFVGTGAKAGRGIYGQNSAATITLKNCSFENLGYPIYTMAGGGYASLVVEGCTFEGIKSWAIMPQYNSYLGDLTVTGNTFKDCVGGLVKAGAFTAGHTFTFTNNVVTGCTVSGDHNWFSINTAAATKVVSGNVKDGVEWTPGEAQGLK